jgi:hypothetical protein
LSLLLHISLISDLRLSFFRLCSSFLLLLLHFSDVLISILIFFMRHWQLMALDLHAVGNYNLNIVQSCLRILLHFRVFLDLLLFLWRFLLCRDLRSNL